ncbi:MAG: hydroxyacylglutathione hydrolase [Alkalibacterium sp.]|uniref:hydroxyacylglutathione hydrolase n=1 Tax=Alkalibacterium sp. TaxID=1872447 RepID=UPI003970E88E
MHIHPIKSLSDNYIWIIEEGTEAVVVDPGEAEGVIAYLEEQQLHLAAILLTHNHDDHIGGVKEISANYPNVPIYGPKETEPLAKLVIQDGDSFELLGRTFQVFKTAGHTHGHISFLMGEALFCGDALFSAGCGRVFTKDYQAQYAALQKFKDLNDDVHVYAAHEYTQTNLRFAHSLQPANKVISEALDQVDQLRAEGRPTLPSMIGKEKSINLFLQAETLEEFIRLRKARDNFQ